MDIVLPLDDPSNVLNGLAVQRSRSTNGFESVVLRRIVAAGNHDCAIGSQVLCGVIENWCRHHADVRDIASTGKQTLHQCIAQTRGAEAAIAAYVNVFTAAVVL